jgi:hypothetical protein
MAQLRSQISINEKLSYDDISFVDKFSDDLTELLAANVNSRSHDSFQSVGLKIFARVFGEDNTGLEFHTGIASWRRDNRGISGPGGWIKRLSGKTSGGHGWNSLPSGTRKLLDNFLPDSTYMNAMLGNSSSGNGSGNGNGNEYKVLLNMFPSNAQIFIKNYEYYECISSPNQIVYFPPYFKTMSDIQHQSLLNTINDSQSAMMLKFNEYYYICLLRYPKQYPETFQMLHNVNNRNSNYSNYSSNSSGQAASNININGRSLATSLALGKIPGMIFGNNSNVLPPSSYASLMYKGIDSLIDGNVYMVLLNRIIGDYVKHAVSSDGGGRNINVNVNSRSTAKSPARGTGVGNGTGKSGRNNNGLLNQDVSLSPAAELFIRLIAEYWMGSPTLVRKNHIKGANYKALLNKMMTTPSNINMDPMSKNVHPLPTDILLLNSNLNQWNSSTMQCVYIVINRMLSDPFLAEQFAAITESNGLAFESHHIMANLFKPSAGGGGGGYNRNSNSNSNNSLYQASVVCPPALGLIQQPLFDMLRTLFNKADTGHSSDWEMHALAVETWLAYIQPWKAESIARSTPLSKLNTNTNSRGQQYDYNKTIWLPYIAANLHFYTTIFVCFLKSVCKNDLSIIENPGIVHLLLLEKVLLVFEPLMNDINLLVKDFYLWYPDHVRDNGSGLKPKQRSPGVGVGNSWEYGTPKNKNKNKKSNDDDDDDYDGGNVTSLSLLVAIKHQHHWLFPDAAIDRLSDFGIVNISDFTKPKLGPKILSLLKVAMDDTKPSKKKNITSIELITEWFDFFLGLDFFGPYTFTKAVHFMGIGSDNKVDNTLIERLQHSYDKLQIITGCNSDSITTDNNNDKENGYDSNNRISKSYEDIAVTDENTGLLKNEGIKILKNGGIIPIDGLRWFGDELELPYCTYEIIFLVKIFVKLSLYLNKKYNLPRIGSNANKWTWAHCYRHLSDYNDNTNTKAPIIAKFQELLNIMRFNFRFLAHIRVISSLIIIILSHTSLLILLNYIQEFIKYGVNNTIIIIFGMNMLSPINLILTIISCSIHIIELIIRPCSYILYKLNFLTLLEHFIIIGHFIYLFYHNTISLPKDYYSFLFIVGVISVIYHLSIWLF